MTHPAPPISTPSTGRLGAAWRRHGRVLLTLGDQGLVSLASFATEWRAYPMTTWGATRKGPTDLSAAELGYTEEMAGLEGDRRTERTNPELTDGAYHGPSRGHLQPRWAEHIGMPRGYGYGASMGAWVLDYVSGWAGEWGMVSSASAQYRNPAFTGDATILRGEVTGHRVHRGVVLSVRRPEIRLRADSVGLLRKSVVAGELLGDLAFGQCGQVRV